MFRLSIQTMRGAIKRIFKMWYCLTKKLKKPRGHPNETNLFLEIGDSKELADFTVKRSAHVLALTGAIVFLCKYAIGLAWFESERVDDPYLLLIIISAFLSAALHVLIKAAQYFIGLGRLLGLLGTTERNYLAVRLEIHRYRTFISLIKFYLIVLLSLAPPFIVFYINLDLEVYILNVWFVPSLLVLMFYFVKDSFQSFYSWYRIIRLLVLEIGVSASMNYFRISLWIIYGVELSILICVQYFEDRNKTNIERITRRLVIAVLGFNTIFFVSLAGAFLFYQANLLNNNQAVMDERTLLKQVDSYYYKITLIGKNPPQIRGVKVNGKLVREEDEILVGSVTIPDQQNLFSRLIQFMKETNQDLHMYIVNLKPYIVTGKNVIEVDYEWPLRPWLMSPYRESIRASFYVTE